MKKCLLLFSTVLVVAALCYYSLFAVESQAFPTLWCVSGGPGANQCSLNTESDVVEIGESVSCGICCPPNAYACCTLDGCICAYEIF